MKERHDLYVTCCNDNQDCTLEQWKIATFKEDTSYKYKNFLYSMRLNKMLPFVSATMKSQHRFGDITTKEALVNLRDQLYNDRDHIGDSFIRLRETNIMIDHLHLSANAHFDDRLSSQCKEMASLFEPMLRRINNAVESFDRLDAADTGATATSSSSSSMAIVDEQPVNVTHEDIRHVPALSIVGVRSKIVVVSGHGYGSIVSHLTSVLADEWAHNTNASPGSVIHAGSEGEYQRVYDECVADIETDAPLRSRCMLVDGPSFRQFCPDILANLFRHASKFNLTIILTAKRPTWIPARLLHFVEKLILVEPDESTEVLPCMHSLCNRDFGAIVDSNILEKFVTFLKGPRETRPIAVLSPAIDRSRCNISFGSLRVYPSSDLGKWILKLVKIDV